MIAAGTAPRRIALVGNPNCGKTSLFNQLTGSRQKVANYPGVTVERKEGRCLTGSGRTLDVVDLPGAYSLSPTSPDEAITRDVCLGQLAGERPADLLVCVANATDLRLHLRLALELRALGRPMILVLNMIDEARRHGIRIDRAALERELGIPVIQTVAVRRGGAAELAERLDDVTASPSPMPHAHGDVPERVRRLLAVAVISPTSRWSSDDTIDRWVLHPFYGLVILGMTLYLIFQAVFLWAQPFVNMIQAGINGLSGVLTTVLPAGFLQSLIVNGVLAGAGSVLVFVPQILMLFLFIFVLEESGYLPRAAFLLDRLMVGSGLTGRSFIPLLSSFACAVPGIMATRSIQDPRDRLATIVVAPLMTCSARLPVYALLIGVFVPARTLLGFVDLRGLVLLGLYAAGICAAVAVALILKLVRRDRTERAFLLELPPYRWPNPRDLGLALWERARIFVFQRVGKIIVACSVILWFVSSFPLPPAGAVGPAIDYSLAGRVGHLMLYVFAPLGFSWQICVSLIPGMAAREVVISSLATTYALSAGGSEATTKLAPIIASHWSAATAFALLAWYVFSPQCISTLAVIRRETNSARTMMLVGAYLLALAYVATFVVYRIGCALGGGGSPA